MRRVLLLASLILACERVEPVSVEVHARPQNPYIAGRTDTGRIICPLENGRGEWTGPCRIVPIRCGIPTIFSQERPSVESIALFAGQCADYYRIPGGLFAALISTESRWRIEARGRHGEIGLTQLKKETARDLKVDPYYWPENLEGGARYLARCKEKRSSWRGALECYNGGSDAWVYAARVLQTWGGER